MSWVFIKKQEKRQIDLVVPDPLSVWLGRPMLALSGGFSMLAREPGSVG